MWDVSKVCQKKLPSKKTEKVKQRVGPDMKGATLMAFLTRHVTRVVNVRAAKQVISTSYVLLP